MGRPWLSRPLPPVAWLVKIHHPFPGRSWLGLACLACLACLPACLLACSSLVFLGRGGWRRMATSMKKVAEGPLPFLPVPPFVGHQAKEGGPLRFRMILRIYLKNVKEPCKTLGFWRFSFGFPFERSQKEVPNEKARPLELGLRLANCCARRRLHPRLPRGSGGAFGGGRLADEERERAPPPKSCGVSLAYFFFSPLPEAGQT